MSVIIRLQNLPWNANALDIRRFFQGLSIPDGGVHIIGGEKGDAFIAFSTDEDARQAMIKDAGRINGYAIKLLLSSKTEMQNVIAAAKGGPPPPLPAASSMGISKPGGFYDRTIIPPLGGGQVPFVGGSAGGDVIGSGQGLRSSTGLGLQQAMPYGYPGSSSQVMPAAPPAGYVVRMNEPVALPAVPAMPPPAGRSIFDTSPSGNLQQPPPAAPMDPLGSGLRPSLPGPPPAAAWGSSTHTSRDVPPPNFGRPADIPGAQGARFGALNPSAGRESVRMDGVGQPDMGYPRNGHAYVAPESGRNFIPGLDAGRNLGPPPDVGRDFRRTDGGLSGRHEEPRDLGRFGENVHNWDRSDRNAAGPGQGWSSGGRSFGGRDGDDSRREFQRSDIDRVIPASDRWLESRSMGHDRGGPRESMPNEGAWPRSGAGDFNDRFDRSRPPVIPEVPGSRYGPDSGLGGMPDSRLRGESRGGFAQPDPGFREPARPLMEENLRRPPEERWMEERRGFGLPPLPGFEGRPLSPPRDRPFQGGFFPRDEPWHNKRRDFDPRQTSDPASDHNLSIRATNFPRTFNYRDIRRIFSGCEIPRDGVKLLNDRLGMRTGVVFVLFADARSLKRALDMNGKMVDSCRITVERCTDADFDAAVDGKPMGRMDRSRSPRSRQVDKNSNLTFFVLKKLPAKTEKEDIQKFFEKFRIAADGGPFFELAFDKSQTGNALVALEETDVGKVLTLHHSLLNGTRVDVVRINSYEFAERSRRARQLERDGDKNVGQSKPPNMRDAKTEKQDPKSKELDRSGSSAVDDDGRQQSGHDVEQRTYCVELRGVPYTASPAMIQDYFHDISIPVESIHISYNREHRATGIAFVEFSSTADQKRALEKDKQHMGHRIVDIRPLSKLAMIEEYNKQQQKFGGPPLQLHSGRSNTDCSKQGSKVLSMQNLHFDTQLEDILDFFAGYQPIVDSIQLQYKDNKPTGDGLVAFETLLEAESAMRSKNRHLLRGKPVTLAWSKN